MDRDFEEEINIDIIERNKRPRTADSASSRPAQRMRMTAASSYGGDSRPSTARSEVAAAIEQVTLTKEEELEFASGLYSPGDGSSHLPKPVDNPVRIKGIQTEGETRADVEAMASIGPGTTEQLSD